MPWFLLPNSASKCQLQANYAGLRRIRKGGTQAIDHFLLLTAVVNSYLLFLYSNWPHEIVKTRSQVDFRTRLIESLLEAGKDALGPRKRSFSGVNQEAYEVPIHRHRQVKMATRSNCAACKGGRYQDRPLKRVALSEIAANSGRPSDRRTTWYGCKECHIHLCKNNGCFERYHQNSWNPPPFAYKYGSLIGSLSLWPVHLTRGARRGS